MAPLARKPSISVALNRVGREPPRCALRFPERACGHFGNAMHLNRTADRGGQFAAGASSGTTTSFAPQLRIVDHILRVAHGAERDVDAIEDLVPMRHRLRAEDLVEDRRQLGRVLPPASPDRKIAGLSADPVRPIAFATAANLSGVTMRTNQVHRQPGTRSAPHSRDSCDHAGRKTSPHTATPGSTRSPTDALGEKRGRDIGSFAGAFTTIKRCDDRRIEAYGGRIVTASGHRPSRRRAGIARHRQQAAARPV